MTYQVRGIIACVICGNEKTIGRKLCRNCYYVATRNGTLKNFPILAPEDVFENRINKTPTCWIWTGHTNHDGYGIFVMPNDKKVRAHRYSYEFYKGKIPEGKIIMHTCDNPPCVNPDHLRIGTKAENNRDTGIKKRHNYGLQHWNGRLSDQQIDEIKQSDQPQVYLAKKYDVAQSYISRIRSGARRK